MKTCYLYTLGILMIFGTLYVIHAQTITFSKRIISGTRAAVNQFPWHVILKRDEFDVLLCGGSLISDSWVLTAAHCFKNITSVFLVFGTIDLRNDDINMTSTEIFMHPQYNEINFNNDIALIQLPETLNFTSSIQAIKLVTTALAATGFIGAQAIVAGFGQLNDEEVAFPDTLQWAQVEIVNTSKCAEVYGEDLAAATNICARGYNDTNMSICQGDSGGALVWLNDADSFVQIGISSYVALNQCTQNFPAGYTRLSSYMDFIQNITGIHFEDAMEIA
ncbi:brachyurin-like [Calliphora vicina]|uniref:brachyurin-like n=1 Tax=Calliphora vicina TaxID=7373 RepID=UPI00325AB76D